MKISLTYRLQPLLELKKRAKQRAEIELARAIALLEEGKKRLKRLEEEKQEVLRRQKECRLKLHEKVASGRARIRDGSFRVNFLRKLEEDEKVKQTQIEAQQKRIEECETAVKRARRDYINAVKELRIMEKHKELWRRKVELELSRREEREMDELGNIIHHLRGSRRPLPPALVTAGMEPPPQRPFGAGV